MDREILNDRDAKLARAKLTLLNECTAPDAIREWARSSVPSSVRHLHQQSLHAWRSKLEADIAFFEKLKAGDDQGLLQEIEGQIGLSLIVRRIKLGLSQSELAERVGVREQQIQRYESERYASITVRLLQRISRALGARLTISPEEDYVPNVNSLQKDLLEIEPSEVRRDLLHMQSASGSILSDFDLSDDTITDIIKIGKKKIGSNDLYRKTANFEENNKAAQLLLWRGCLSYAFQQCKSKLSSSYDPTDIEWMAEVPKLSRYADGPRQAFRLLHSHGIGAIAMACPKGLRLDGIAAYEDNTPIIGLTLRFDRIDYFWFTLMHELGHVALHHRFGLRDGFIDESLSPDSPDELEAQANLFAQDLLIPPEAWRTAPARLTRSKKHVEGAAAQLGIHAAIIYGRIRWEGNDFKIFSSELGGDVRAQFWRE